MILLRGIKFSYYAQRLGGLPNKVSLRKKYGLQGLTKGVAVSITLNFTQSYDRELRSELHRFVVVNKSAVWYFRNKLIPNQERRAKFTRQNISGYF